MGLSLLDSKTSYTSRMVLSLSIISFALFILASLRYFLNEISFNSTLISIEETKLLEKIYEKIPEDIKPLVEEAFTYAKEIFLEKRIKDNEGKIYLKK